MLWGIPDNTRVSLVDKGMKSNIKADTYDVSVRKKLQISNGRVMWIPILCGSRPYFQMWQLFFALLRDSVYSRQGLLHLLLVRNKGIRCLSVH